MPLQTQIIIAGAFSIGQTEKLIHRQSISEDEHLKTHLVMPIQIQISIAGAFAKDYGGTDGHTDS